MSHQLDFITPSHMALALEKLKNGEVPKDHQWSEYWINHQGRHFQFKYCVELAARETRQEFKTTDFTSNTSSRGFIASLGFHILYKSANANVQSPRYWVAGSQFGTYGAHIDVIHEFLKGRYWQTDHDLTQGEGTKLLEILQEVKLNDRLCIRYFDKKQSRVEIAAIGTVTDLSAIASGKLGIQWDYNPPKYKGAKPSGSGSGNWWKTIFELKKREDIAMIFGEQMGEWRLARLAYNDTGWVEPSGKTGKSTDPSTHEAQFGFGYEEWLFDLGKIIAGYHYGFLEPVRGQPSYVNNEYNVWLYTVHAQTGRRFWAGTIHNVTVIDQEEAEGVYQEYARNHWLTEMEQQVIASGANEDGFSNWVGVNMFNIKFRPENITLNDPYIEIPVDHPVHKIKRYTFAHPMDNMQLIHRSKQGPVSTDGQEEDEVDGEVFSTTYTRPPKIIEIRHLHEKISKALKKLLRSQYGKDKVVTDCNAGYGYHEIDLRIEHAADVFTFVEIKTYNNVKSSIREAIGQLLEYCHYPDQIRASKLIIVSHLPPDAAIEGYMKHLRTCTNLRIYYQHFDLDKGILSKEY
ncbi:hypothetical protein [Longitalea luteola]|uniref:hypothetical protein n=1 Tax=Longitalea luteola TaxID=2812563 RepID=UPI001A958F62|nr:hypothetical protein [Longitalea luteola]